MDSQPNTTTTPQNQAQRDAQRAANEISARLARLAKDPPDLTAYLKAHAQTVSSVLRPTGVCYEMLTGAAFKRVLASETEELREDIPAQKAIYRKAIQQAAEENKPIVLQPNVQPEEGTQTLSVEEVAESSHLTLFNITPHQIYIVPIPLGSKVVGALMAWFPPADTAGTNTRMQLLRHACNEIALYLKTRKAEDVSLEINRLNTYIHLLESLSGDLELDDISWNIVNYARESVDCERVSIFVAKKYPYHNLKDFEFELLATSGIKKPYPRSEHAEILKGMARELAIFTLSQSSAPAQGPGGPRAAQPGAQGQAKALPEGGAPGAEASVAAVDGETAGADGGEEPQLDLKEVEEKSDISLLRLSADDKPRLQLTLTYRETPSDKRPDAVNDYFEAVPMNWVTALPLFDRDNQVCGILLFEGRKHADKIQNSFVQMRDLAFSSGRALGTALYWHNRRSLRLAKDLAYFRTRAARSDKRALLFKILVPIFILAAVLAVPVPYKVKGQATLRPVEYRTLPAMISARLADINVREGQEVQEDDLLAVLDARDQEFMLQQTRQQYQGYLAEADMALTVGNEFEMQSARLNAERALITAEKLETEIESARIRAPFDGVIVGPQDLKMRLGQFYRIGETIIEIAKPGKWECKIDVREQDLVFLDEYLAEHETVAATVKFTADPTREHELELNDPSQLAYGLTTTQNQYAFSVVLPLNAEIDDDTLKIGYSGKAAFKCGRRPIAYIFFHDFINYIKVRIL